ncbi:hypothetical protein [Sulfitobacter sp. JB4-11]|uniref:hypothetical protein n=1 Tax=Sulfitobacter rhodophyticola TaxID=3238304 RepID=UPI00351712D9
MSDTPDLYPGGFAKLMKALETRQRRFDGIEAVLPPPDVDLAPMFNQPTAAPAQPYKDITRYTAARKWAQLQGTFEGQPRILHLHAMLIAISRRDDPPADALTLFFRIWDEHGDRLAPMLTVRWMISTATTFSDIGRTGDQRACGMALSILFDSIKLHDSERRLSGQPGRRPFRAMKARKRFPVAFGMPPYSYKGGDLDQIMLARIWQLCERDSTIRPLGMAMLNMVMTDPRSIFARVQELKKLRRARDGKA